MNLTFDVNWIAVLVSTVAFAALGGLYFTVLVPRPYAAALGRQDAPRHTPPPSAFVGQLVATLLVVLTTAVLISSLGLQTLSAGLVFGLVIGVGFLTAMTVNIAINPNFPRPFLYAAVNAPYFIVGSLMTSVVLTLLR